MKRLAFILVLITTKAMAQQLAIEDSVKFLALGDSYTIGQSVATNERWPVQLNDSLKKRGLHCSDVKIIATTGWRTDNLKSAIVGANLKNEYTLVSLLIGVNNYYQGKSVESYKPEFEELLNIAIALAGGNKSHVFVVSIPDYGYTPYGKSNQPTISQGIDLFNEANKAITSKSGVPYFGITDISRRGLAEPELVASDGLHPSGKMYTEWVERILQGSLIVEGSGDAGEDPPTGDTTHVVTGVKGEQYGFYVYPNPFFDHLTLSNLPGVDIYQYDLIDNRGAVAFTSTTVKRTENLDLSSLSAGIYYLRLRDSRKTILQRRVIKARY